MWISGDDIEQLWSQSVEFSSKNPGVSPHQIFARRIQEKIDDKLKEDQYQKDVIVTLTGEIIKGIILHSENVLKYNSTKNAIAKTAVTIATKAVKLINEQ